MDLGYGDEIDTLDDNILVCLTSFTLLEIDIL